MKQLMQYILDRCDKNTIDNVLRSAKIQIDLGGSPVTYVGGGMIKTASGGVLDLNVNDISSIVVSEPEPKPVPELSVADPNAGKGDETVQPSPDAGNQDEPPVTEGTSQAPIEGAATNESLPESAGSGDAQSPPESGEESAGSGESKPESGSGGVDPGLLGVK